MKRERIPIPSEEVTRSWHAEVLFGQLSNVELGDHEGGDEGDVLVDVHGLRRAHGVGANAYADGDRDSIVWAEVEAAVGICVKY